jgi:HJR/Mrr/RecB family endonuclease
LYDATACDQAGVTDRASNFFVSQKSSPYILSYDVCDWLVSVMALSIKSVFSGKYDEFDKEILDVDSVVFHQAFVIPATTKANAIAAGMAKVKNARPGKNMTHSVSATRYVDSFLSDSL